MTVPGNQTSFDAQVVLLVEDNEDDVFIFNRAMRNTGLKNKVHVARTGHEAVEYLSGTGAYADREKFPLPILVLLDIKLPFKDGLEVLEWMRGHKELHAINVIMLTSSAEDRDIERARSLGAHAYLVKPPELKTLQELAASLREAWMSATPFKRVKLQGDKFGNLL